MPTYSLPEYVSSELRRTEAAMTYANVIPSETYSYPSWARRYSVVRIPA